MIETQPTVLHEIVPEVVGLSSEMVTVNRPAKIAEIISSAHDIIEGQEDTWSSFLSQFQIFMNAMDKVAEVCVLNVLFSLLA